MRRGDCLADIPHIREDRFGAGAFDALSIELIRPDGTKLATLAMLDNSAPAGQWEELTFDLTAYAGQNAAVQFVALPDQNNISITGAQYARLGGPNPTRMPGRS